MCFYIKYDFYILDEEARSIYIYIYIYIYLYTYIYIYTYNNKNVDCANIIIHFDPSPPREGTFGGYIYRSRWQYK